MTITLAIDTSTSRTSVGIIEAGEVLWSGFKDGATASVNVVEHDSKQGLHNVY